MFNDNVPLTSYYNYYAACLFPGRPGRGADMFNLNSLFNLNRCLSFESLWLVAKQETCILFVVIINDCKENTNVIP